MMIYLYLVTAAALLVNSFAMLFYPSAWYVAVPGVTESGPMNVHFIRDIGCGDAVAGCGLLWRAFDAVRGWTAALVGASWLLAHAAVHSFEELGHGQHGASALNELVGVYLPAIWVSWLALPGRPLNLLKFLKPLRAILHTRVQAFESQFRYDAAYMHHMLEASLPAFLRFGAIEGVAKHREQVPVETWYAAKLVAAISEDCGPCTQLVVRMAEQDSVPEAMITSVLSGNVAAMDDNTALGFQFARAILSHDLVAGDLRLQIETRFGQQALISLALATATARVFPAVKFALGYGQSRTRVRVGSRDYAVSAPLQATVRTTLGTV